MYKLAVLADIHANYAALEAVAADIERWGADAVVVAGDIVNRGPRSDACWQFVTERQRKQGWQIVRGNHEDYVLNVARDGSDRPGLEGAVRQSVRWAAQQLGPAALALDGLPFSASLRAPDGGEVRVVHASMRHTRDNIMPDTPDDKLRQQIAPAPPLICVGHTHRPLVRRIDSTLVVNVGSVGMPFDGDPRASYGRLQWNSAHWNATITRVPYDRQRAARDFITTGFMREAGPVAPLIFDEFRTARPRLFRWMEMFLDPVLRGEWTPDETVYAYLEMMSGDVTAL